MKKLKGEVNKSLVWSRSSFMQQCYFCLTWGSLLPPINCCLKILECSCNWIDPALPASTLNIHIFISTHVQARAPISHMVLVITVTPWSLFRYEYSVLWNTWLANQLDAHGSTSLRQGLWW
jgi:hypothetical protein